MQFRRQKRPSLSRISRNTNAAQHHVQISCAKNYPKSVKSNELEREESQGDKNFLMLKRVSSYNKIQFRSGRSPYNYTTELQFFVPFYYTSTSYFFTDTHTRLLHPDTRALVPKVTQNRPRITVNYGQKFHV